MGRLTLPFLVRGGLELSYNAGMDRSRFEHGRVRRVIDSLVLSFVLLVSCSVAWSYLIRDFYPIDPVRTAGALVFPHFAFGGIVVIGLVGCWIDRVSDAFALSICVPIFALLTTVGAFSGPYAQLLSVTYWTKVLLCFGALGIQLVHLIFVTRRDGRKNERISKNQLLDQRIS